MGNTPEAKNFLELFKKDKPRYYHDNVREILKHIDKYSACVIKKTISLCLENEVFNANSFKEMLLYYKQEEEGKFKTRNIKLPINKNNYTEDKSLIPRTSNINIYNQLI